MCESKNSLDEDDDVFVYLKNRLEKASDLKSILSNHNPAQLA